MFVQSVQQCSKRAKDLVLDFISIPKISEKSGMFSVYVREIKNAMDFHITLLRTNYNSVFQQTSDCRLIFCYETETRVNEANCVYQCFKQKKEANSILKQVLCQEKIEENCYSCTSIS